MSPLVKVACDVKERINAASLVSLFLDFDGTLVPIEADPGLPRLDAGTAQTLGALATRDLLITTIISGRALEDLCARVRIQGIIYAGNHGLEIRGRNLQFVEPGLAARRPQLEQLCEQLHVQLQAVRGAAIDFKGLTASVHYRQAAEADRPAIEEAVRCAVSRAGSLFRVSRGRKVFEILPRTGWHKGTAVRWINERLGCQHTLSIYLGDDTTDEEAFRVLPDAVTIKVGPPRATRARHTLPDPAAVHEFLLWLAAQSIERPRKE